MIPGRQCLAEPSPQTRDPFKQPFSSYHFFNTPFGANATWATNSFLSGASIVMNANSNSCNFFEGTANSPPWIVSTSDNTIVPTPSVNLQYPALAPPGSFYSAGSDNVISLTDGANPRYAYAGFGVSMPSANTINYYRMGVIDNYSQNNACGQSIFGGPQVAGITQYDLESGAIAHRINCGLNFYPNGTTSGTSPGNQTSFISGQPWPSCECDATFKTEYINPNGIPYGSVIGIPSSTANPGGVFASGGGLIFWNCMQQYGMYVNVSAGNYPNITIYGAGGMKEVSGTILGQIRACFSSIIPYLRVMSNPQPIVPGQGFGGGSPVVSLLPGVQSGYAALGQPPYSVPATPALTPIMGSGPSTSTAAPGTPCFNLANWTLPIPAGSFVVLGLYPTAAGSFTWTGVTDSTGASNVYHIIQPTANASTPQIALVYCLKTVNPITASTTWTATESSSVSYYATTGVYYIPSVRLTNVACLKHYDIRWRRYEFFDYGVASTSGDLIFGMGAQVVALFLLVGIGSAYGSLWFHPT